VHQNDRSRPPKAVGVGYKIERVHVESNPDTFAEPMVDSAATEGRPERDSQIEAVVSERYDIHRTDGHGARQTDGE
jgi:hypothetical protein